MKKGDSPLIWIDLEMSGLCPDYATIFEIAVIATDSDLNVIEKGPEVVVHHDEFIFESMDAFVHQMHSSSGLLEEVKFSDISMLQAEEQVLEFLKKHCEFQKSPLCGNSVWVDRTFLRAYMPRVELFLHYRMIDVSTIKELYVRWGGKEFDKKKGHRALDDILESIEELKYYRKNFLKMPK
ncbi:oligoribonuclease [bacterium]|jgi:oligoribonuclease|nr:oligoribonuclease [bacterium]